MATKDTGFVDVSGKLEPSALAGGIAIEAHNRLGEMVVCTADWLDDDGNPLTQRQVTALTSNASRFFDGFEGVVIDLISDAISDANMRSGS